jgi:hypothetical protein
MKTQTWHGIPLAKQFGVVELFNSLAMKPGTLYLSRRLFRKVLLNVALGRFLAFKSSLKLSVFYG